MGGEGGRGLYDNHPSTDIHPQSLNSGEALPLFIIIIIRQGACPPLETKTTVVTHTRGPFIVSPNIHGGEQSEWVSGGAVLHLNFIICGT